MWLAWDEFEFKNGAATFDEFHRLLVRIRRSKGMESDPAGTYEIGCILLSEPVFFAPEAWIPAPGDWSDNTVQGAGYDLDRGEGARIWAHCLAVAGGLPVGAGPAGREHGPLYEGPRTGKPVLRAPRMGQGIFRAAVTDAYGRACAVTTEHSLPVLEAAHIRPYGEGGEHALSNGLLLRTDIHRLFDRGYVTITPDLRFRVSRRLKDEFANGRTYYSLEGTKVATPTASGARPAAELLEWHSSARFRP